MPARGRGQPAASEDKPRERARAHTPARAPPSPPAPRRSAALPPVRVSRVRRLLTKKRLEVGGASPAERGSAVREKCVRGKPRPSALSSHGAGTGARTHARRLPPPPPRRLARTHARTHLRSRQSGVVVVVPLRAGREGARGGRARALREVRGGGGGGARAASEGASGVRWLVPLRPPVLREAGAAPPAPPFPRRALPRSQYSRNQEIRGGGGRSCGARGGWSRGGPQRGRRRHGGAGAR